jgi:hypothetical protein
MGSVAPYINDVKDQFLPADMRLFLVREVCLVIFYLVRPDIAFSKIEKGVPCTLSHHQEFLARNHKTSDHKRTVPPDKLYPANFRCHHLILNIVGVVASASS